MKKVLIALDCTANAKDVAFAGKDLTNNIGGSEIILLHGLLQPDYYFSGQYAPILGFNEYYNTDLARLIEGGELKNAVSNFMNNLKNELSLPNAEIKIIDGSPEDVIIDVSANNQVDMIVVGKKSSAPFDRIGRVTEMVLKQSSMPVYVVPTSKDLNEND